MNLEKHLDECGITKPKGETFYLDLYKDLQENGTIIFPYSDNSIDSYIISLSIDFNKLGSFPFSGQCGNLLVGLVGCGFYHFNINDHSMFSGGYIAEKLGLGNGDAIAALLNGMAEHWNKS